MGARGDGVRGGYPRGIETAVFLLAAFQASGDASSAGIGALLGMLCAVAIGWGIYRGGVRLNLGRFFRITAAILVLIAAGLVASAIHTAHEAAWLNHLQQPAVDLSWLVQPGSVSSSLFTGMLGVQPLPTIGEAVGWLIYAVPMLAYVLWPGRRSLRRRGSADRVRTAASGTRRARRRCAGGADRSSLRGSPARPEQLSPRHAAGLRSLQRADAERPAAVRPAPRRAR